MNTLQNPLAKITLLGQPLDKILVRPGVLPDGKAREQNIMRHTFISNLSRIEPIGEVCYQCATSMSMIRKHYKVLITDKKRVEEFFSIKPKDFGLS